MKNEEHGLEISKDTVSFFTQYVAERNIAIMSKPEWEQLYFYCTARTLFPGRKLVSLTVQDLYVIGKTLRLDNNPGFFHDKGCNDELREKFCRCRSFRHDNGIGNKEF